MESQGQPCLKGLPSLALGATAIQNDEDGSISSDHEYTIPTKKANLSDTYYRQQNKTISTTRVEQSDDTIPNVLLDEDEDDDHDDKTCHPQHDHKLQGSELDAGKHPIEMQQYAIHVDEIGRVTTIPQGLSTGDLNELPSSSNVSSTLSPIKDNNNKETSSLVKVALDTSCHGDNTKGSNPDSVNLVESSSGELSVNNKQHISGSFNSPSATDMAEFSYGDLTNKDGGYHAVGDNQIEGGQSSKNKLPVKLDLEHLQLLNTGGSVDYIDSLPTMNTNAIQDTSKNDAKNIKLPSGTLILNTSANTTKPADMDTIPIQVYPQGHGISLVTSSGILTADISTFSTQVPTILTEGDADDADPSTNFAEQFQVVTTSNILAGTSHAQTHNNEMLSVMMSPSDLSKSVILTAEQQQAILGEVIAPGVGGAQTLHITIPSVNSTSGHQAVLAGQPVEEGTMVTGEQEGGDGQVRAIQVHLLSSNQVPVNKGPEVEKVKSCPHADCGKVCHRANKLKLQMPANAGERPHKCPHEGCEWAFTTAYKLKRHERGHTGERPFMCPYEECGRRFTTAYNLKTHVKAHTRTNTILCQYEGCDKSFPTLHKYRVHERKHQQEDKPFKCEVDGCGKEFSAMGALTSHIKCHSGERPHGCPVETCGKRFTKASKLKLHLRTHTGERPFACDAEGCGWSFTSAYKLKRHMRKHTGERPYVCSYEGCHKSFTRSSHLKTHTLVHTGEKPYVCPMDGCNKAFTAGSSLNVHMRKHTGEKPFRCEEDGCSKAYTTASNLRAHQKRHDRTSKIIVEGPEDHSLSQDYVTVSTMSNASNASSLVDNDSDVTYSGMHTFTSEDFTTDDVTAIPVSVHFPAGSLSAIVTNTGNPLTFSTAGSHEHTDVGDEQKGTVARVALPVANMEVDGSHIDVAEFVVRNDNVEPVLQHHVVSKHSDEHMKHDSGFDLSITSIVNQLRSHETSPNGKLSTSDVLTTHGGERLVIDSKFVPSHSRSLEFRTPVNPEDQFKPPAVIFQEDSNKSGSSDTEAETPAQPHADLPTTMQITLPQEVIQIHFPHQSSPLPSVPGNNDTPMETETTTGHHQLQSFESSSLSELQGHKTPLSPYLEQSAEADEGHVEVYPESTINLQDLR